MSQLPQMPGAVPCTDHLSGSESDSGLTLGVVCARCGRLHQVALSTLGRFAFKCGAAEQSGAVVPNVWQELRAAGIARGPGQTLSPLVVQPTE